jgi:hypothetical protein
MSEKCPDLTTWVSRRASDEGHEDRREVWTVVNHGGFLSMESTQKSSREWPLADWW